MNECLEAKPEAGFELGECARMGQGTSKNFETAFDHYLKAAEDGSEAKAAIGRAFFWVKELQSDQNGEVVLARC